MKNGFSILHIQEDEAIRQQVRESFAADVKSFLVTDAVSLRALYFQLDDRPYDVVISDVAPFGLNPLEILDHVWGRHPEIPIILLTETGDSLEKAVEAMKRGVSDYLIRTPENMGKLPASVRGAIESRHLDGLRLAELARLNAALRHEEAASDYLKEELLKFSRITEQSPNMVAITDLKGRVEYVNPRFSQITGYNLKDVYGKSLDILRTDSQPRNLYADIWETVSALGGWQGEILSRRKDGESFWESASITPILNTDDEVTHYLKISEDITQHKVAEDALVQYAKEENILHTIISAVSQSLNLDDLLSSIFEVVLPALKTQIGWIIMPENDGKARRVVGARGISPALIDAEQQIPFVECPFYKMTQTGKGDKLSALTGCDVLLHSAKDEAGIVDHVCIPFVAGGELFGILKIGWQEARHFSEGDLDFLMTIGQQIGLAFRNAQLYNAARQVDYLQFLNQLDRTLSTTLEIDVVARVALEQIAEGLNVRAGALILLHPESEAVDLIFSLQGGSIESIRSGSEALSAQIAAWKTHVRPFAVPASDIGEVPGNWDKGALAIPIGSEQAVIGFILMSEEHPFNEEALTLASVAAGRIDQAFRNARLYASSRHYSERLIMLNAIRSATVQSLDVDTVMQRVLTLTCQALDAAHGVVLMERAVHGKMAFVLNTKARHFEAIDGRAASLQNDLIEKVMRTGQSLCFKAERPRNLHPDFLHEEVDSLLCAPITYRGKVQGIIEIVNKQEGNFTEEEGLLLEAISSIAGGALENARLYMTTRERADELELLNQIGLALTSKLDPAQIIDEALFRLKRLFQAQAASFVQPDSEAGKMHFTQALDDQRSTTFSVDWEPGAGIVGGVLSEGKPILLADAQSDPRFYPRTNQQAGDDIRSLMAVPLQAAERLVGVLEVISDDKGIYTDSHLQTLQSVASTLTVALENAYLYDEMKQLLRDRKRAQAQLIHSEKMSALGRLVASISHEINNPLQSVQGCLALTFEEIHEGLDVERMEYYLGIIENEIDRVSNIVRRMRDFYRPVREGMFPTDMHRVLDDVLALTAKQFQYSNVTLQRMWADDLPIIEANPDHFKQVFLNLIINAIDAMPQGGKLHISTWCEDIQFKWASEPQFAICVEFSDTGEGMLPEIMSRVFEPFFTTKPEGSGLGLSVSYGIVQAHNGDIHVSSLMGVGTTFTIQLPVKQP